MKELIQKLEAAALRRNPWLAEGLKPGLPVEKIKKELNKAGIEGAIEPLVELYSWRNGMVLQGQTDAFRVGLKAGFAPPAVIQLSEEIKQVMLLSLGVKCETDIVSYYFTELKSSLLDIKVYKSHPKNHPLLPVGAGRYFPFLWNGSNIRLALDLDPAGGSRVVAIFEQEQHPLREAYDSFTDCLKSFILANETNKPLACLLKPGKPLSDETQSKTEAPTAAGTEANMKKIPITENTLALRTDFSDEAAWKSLCATIQDPEDEFAPSLDLVSDPQYAGITAETLPVWLPEDSTLTFALIIDRAAIAQPGHPILVVDLLDTPGRAFRVVAAELGLVASNLEIGNMSFGEFALATGRHGIFRGFRVK